MRISDWSSDVCSSDLVSDHALERLVRRIGAAPVLEGQLDRLAAAAIEDDELYLAGQLLPRRFERKAIGFAEAFEHLHIVRRGRVRFRPRHQDRQSTRLNSSH